MTRAERDALRALCDAATPGPWMADGDAEFYDPDMGYGYEWVVLGAGANAPRANLTHDDTGGDRVRSRDDASYMAACDPATIRALLDAAEAGDEALLQATFRENKHIGELADKLRDALAERDALRAAAEQARESLRKSIGDDYSREALAALDAVLKQSTETEVG